MSKVQLQEVKQDLRITHDLDDAILQRYIDSAEREAASFMDRKDLEGPWDDYVSPPAPCTVSSSSSSSSSSSEEPLPDDVRIAIYFLVRSKYDAPDPADIAVYRDAAEVLLFPYRRGLGV